MYIPQAFKEEDLSAMGAFVDGHPLATLIVSSASELVVDHIPFIRTGELVRGNKLIAHAAKPNPIWKQISDAVTAVLVFTGASAYVSPSLYPSKATNHEVVPTWNYMGVHLRGTLTCSHDFETKRSIVDSMTKRMEASRPAPWALSDAPEPYIARMLSGIVGLVFEIESVEAKTKASQNRTMEDRLGVVAGLAADRSTEEASLAAERVLGISRR